MTVAAILRSAGLVPVIPETRRAPGTAPAVAPQRVPVVPVVPAPKGKGESAAATVLRTHLLALADADYLPAALVHRLHDLDVAACDGLDDPQLRAFLHQLHDTATRHAGKRPAGDTAPILCAHCGPIWAHPSIAAALPVVGGWPRALGCPWCFVRKAGGTIPRPPVACEGCAHYIPDTVNPDAGMGGCNVGHGSHYPMQRHACPDLAPDEKGRLGLMLSYSVGQP
jgi:hypothetical protein